MKNEGVLDYKVAQFLAAEIVNMLHYMQIHKIAHRDIKPANLLFDDFMHLKLIDFGSGKFFKNTDDQEVKVDEGRQSGGKNLKTFRRQNTFVGTVEYMAPEIIQGTWTGNECDFWSLGIIIYKFFAESSPFMGGFEEETIQKIEEDPIIFPPEFPEMAKDLWERLLEKDPSKRLGCGNPGSMNDMFFLKAHPFFDGINFEKLHRMKSPIPIPVVYRASFKQRIIEEYKSGLTTPTEVASPMAIDEDDFSKVVSVWNMKHIDDWKSERGFKVIYKACLKYKSNLFSPNSNVNAIVSDEPAMYLYKSSTGILKGKYELKNYWIKVKGKDSFKLLKKGENELFNFGDNFKLTKLRWTEMEFSSHESIIDILRKFTKS
jgi:serine/threonine protein kinase